MMQRLAQAQSQSASLPALLVQAQRLANGLISGAHGRRRAGVGDTFWQFRPAQPTDGLRMIDHRASAKGDQFFVREREWQIAQNVWIFCDQSASMRYGSSAEIPQKIERARVLSLAMALLLNEGGERFGLFGNNRVLRPSLGRAQILRMAQALEEDGTDDYHAPLEFEHARNAQGLIISDCLGPLEHLEQTLTSAANQGVRGVLLQLLDPAELHFPFQGRVKFQSIQGGFTHETLKAKELRPKYLERLAQRRADVRRLCRLSSWRYGFHSCDGSAQSALLWLHQAMQGHKRR